MPKAALGADALEGNALVIQKERRRAAEWPDASYRRADLVHDASGRRVNHVTVSTGHNE